MNLLKYKSNNFYEFIHGRYKYLIDVNNKQIFNYIQNNKDNIIYEIYKNSLNNLDPDFLLKILSHPYINENMIIEILNSYPELNTFDIWNKKIINNQNISFQFILHNFIYKFTNNIIYDINWIHISSIVELKYVDLYPDYPWCFEALSLNPYLNLEFMKKHKHAEWNWFRLSYNKFVSFDIVDYFINKNWNWYFLSENQNVNMNIIKKYYNKDWNWRSLSVNKNITIKIIEEYNNFPWCYNCYSLNENLTFEYVMKNLSLNWDWEYLSMNNYVLNEKVLIDNLDLPWSWLKICKFIKLSAKFIKQNINNFPVWHWKEYCMNIHFDFDCIELFPPINFNWYFLSENPRITLQIYNKYKIKFIKKMLIENIYYFNPNTIENVKKEYNDKKIKTLNNIIFNNTNLNRDLINVLIKFIDIDTINFSF